jgi:hypothetical protein
MFPTTPTRIKLNESGDNLGKPSLLGRQSSLSSSVDEAVSKASLGSLTTEPASTSSADIIPETYPKNHPYDTSSFKVKSLSDLQNTRRIASDRNSPKPMQMASSSSSTTDQHQSVSPVNDNRAQTIEELKQQYGLTTKLTKRESISNTLSFASMGQQDSEENIFSSVSYQENPLSHAHPGKAAKYEVDSFEDNPMHARSPKYEVESFEENPMLQRSSRYDVDSFEENPMISRQASQAPPAAPETLKRRASSSSSISQIPSPVKSQSIRTAIKTANDTNSTSNETKQSSASERIKTPTKKSVASRRSFSTPTGQLSSSSPTPGNQSDFRRPQANSGNDEFDGIKKAVRPVTNGELDNALDILKYDLHKEIKVVVKEVVRQFEISRVS